MPSQQVRATAGFLSFLPLFRSVSPLPSRFLPAVRFERGRQSRLMNSDFTGEAQRRGSWLEAVENASSPPVGLSGPWDLTLGPNGSSAPVEGLIMQG